MTDQELVKRLRDYREFSEGSAGASFDPVDACLEAADRIEALTAERDELQEVFDFQWRANMRAVEMWRTANPGNDLVLPDSAKLTVWMLEQLEALNAERDDHWKSFVHWRKEADALTEQLEAARADAKEAEAYAEELEVMNKNQEAMIRQADRRGDVLEAKLAKAVEAERARIVKILDGIDRTELDDNGWWETSFGAKFGASVLAAIMKEEGRD